MRVECVEIDPMAFGVPDAELAYYMSLFGVGREKKVFDRLVVGREYTVYAMFINGGRIFYFIDGKRECDWVRAPALCFKIIDARLSAFWKFAARSTVKAGVVQTNITLAPAQWIDEPKFYERLVDGGARELALFADIALKINGEHANAIDLAQ